MLILSSIEMTWVKTFIYLFILMRYVRSCHQEHIECQWANIIVSCLRLIEDRVPVDFVYRYPNIKWTAMIWLNTLRPRQNGRHFAEDILKCNFLNENVWIPIKISLKFVPKGSINYIPALVQIMTWRRTGDKPLSEPMMVSLLAHVCVTRPQ